MFSIIRYSILLILVLAIADSVSAQGKKLSAQEIVQIAIDSAGGDRRMDSLNSVEYIEQLISPEQDTISFAVKRKGYNKYFISVLSLGGYENSTTIYNNGKAILIKNEMAQEITDPLVLEGLLLNCYHSRDYAYKKLGYKLSRLDDLRVDNFDCYTVLAESPLGKTTLNYYDKNKGSLLMIIYPSQNRDIFIDFHKQQGITCPKARLTVDKKGKVSRSFLREIDYYNDMDTNWFNIPVVGSYQTPDTFRTGTFQYIDGRNGSIVRDKNKQVEFGKGGRVEYHIKWMTSSDYLIFRLKDPSAPLANENIAATKCRIISWNGNKYYCQFLTSENVCGTFALQKTADK